MIGLAVFFGLAGHSFYQNVLVDDSYSTVYRYYPFVFLLNNWYSLFKIL